MMVKKQKSKHLMLQPTLHETRRNADKKIKALVFTRAFMYIKQNLLLSCRVHYISSIGSGRVCKARGSLILYRESLVATIACVSD